MWHILEKLPTEVGLIFDAELRNLYKFTRGEEKGGYFKGCSADEKLSVICAPPLSI